LTEDSPVHKSAISNDGNYIAYSLDHSQGSTIVMLFDKAGNELWSFSSQNDSTARAVSMSGDGNYIAAGTSTGSIHLLSKESNIPLWSFSEGGIFSEGVSFSHIGEVKLNSDGSMLAAGGAAKKVYMFSRDSNVPLWEYDAVTYVTFVDFNGEYVVAGTGAREFMFEGNSASPEEVECTEITNPTPYWEVMVEGDTGPVSEGPSVCGDGLCENMKGEDDENCPQDCLRGGVPDGLDNGMEDRGIHLDGMLPVIIVVIVAVAGVLLFLKFRK
jgi:outer membrane protein assembly factor BamB